MNASCFAPITLLYAPANTSENLEVPSALKDFAAINLYAIACIDWTKNRASSDCVATPVAERPGASACAVDVILGDEGAA